MTSVLSRPACTSTSLEDGLVHVGVRLDRPDELGDAPRALLYLPAATRPRPSRRRATRARPRGPPPGRGPRQPVEPRRIEPSADEGGARVPGVLDAAVLEPERHLVLEVATLQRVERRRVRGPARHLLRQVRRRRTVGRASSARLPSVTARSEDSRKTSSGLGWALRPMAAAGLLSSWARPAAMVPSEISFACCWVTDSCSSARSTEVARMPRRTSGQTLSISQKESRSSLRRPSRWWRGPWSGKGRRGP